MPKKRRGKVDPLIAKIKDKYDIENVLTLQSIAHAEKKLKAYKIIISLIFIN